MKNLAIFFVIVVFSVFFISCKDDDFLPQDDEQSIIFTDTPPSQLTAGIKNPSTVYISAQDMNEVVFWGMFPSDRYYDYELNKIIITPCEYSVYKIKGRIYYGFYEGTLYMSKSYAEYSIDLGVLDKLYKVAIQKRYALGTKDVELYYSTGLGLRISEAK